MTMIISRVPVQLLRIEMKMINLPRWFKWVFKSLDASIEFEYIRGVPIPKKSLGRMRSRGIGPWRWGGGEDTEFHYDKL